MPATVTAYNNMINTAYVKNGTYDVDANHVVYDVTAGATHVFAGNTLSARSIRGASLTLDNNAHANMATKGLGRVDQQAHIAELSRRRRRSTSRITRSSSAA
jgi:hypothetical protein